MSFDALGQAWSMIDEEPLHSEIGALIDALLNEFLPYGLCKGRASDACDAYLHERCYENIPDIA